MENETPIYKDKAQPGAFEKLLLKLDPQKGRAAEKYEELRRKLVKFFEWSSCFPGEDLADESFDRLARALENRPVDSLEAFLWGVARNIRQESRRRAEKLVAIADLPDHGTSIRDSANPEEEFLARSESEVRSQCLQMCLRKISGPDRQMFMSYHSIRSDAKEHRERLAAELGLTIGTLRVKINRLRPQLEKCVQKCLARSARKVKGPIRPVGDQ